MSFSLTEKNTVDVIALFLNTYSILILNNHLALHEFHILVTK